MSKKSQPAAGYLDTSEKATLDFKSTMSFFTHLQEAATSTKLKKTKLNIHHCLNCKLS